MIQKEEDGYVIVKFDINQLGNTVNHEIQEGLCGKLIDPQTELKPCEKFNDSSLQAAKKLKYLPTYYKKMPITHKGVKHRFTFTMRGISNPNIQISPKSARTYSKLLSAIKNNDFGTALIIANENIENDSYFIYQKASITTTLANFEYAGKLMLEQRWLNNNYQLRYRVGSEFSYDINSYIKLLISEEFFLSYTAGGFSQNRLIMKASYTPTEKFKITTGLMHWKLQETTRWSILFSLKHSLSL